MSPRSLRSGQGIIKQQFGAKCRKSSELKLGKIPPQRPSPPTAKTKVSLIVSLPQPRAPKLGRIAAFPHLTLSGEGSFFPPSPKCDTQETLSVDPDAGLQLLLWCFGVAPLSHHISPSPFPHQFILPFSLVYGSWGHEASSPLAQHRTYRRWIITLTTVTVLCSWKCSDSPSAEGPSPTNVHSPRTLSRPLSRDFMVTPPGAPLLAWPFPLCLTP